MQEMEIYMQRCLELGLMGLGQTAPNPLVGSVIVIDGKIAGEGYHEKFGGPHAEINAITDALKSIPVEKLKESTLFVNLEPCSHYGKTPPCCDAIIRYGIPNVVFGSMDPFENAAGRGMKKLIDSGVAVISGVYQTACDELNRRFFTFHQKKRPYLILKYAQSADGFIAPDDANQERWISNEWSRKIVHQWRTEEPGIMVGTNTVLQDNPLLTARNRTGNQPVRIILDRYGRIPRSMNVFNEDAGTIVFSCIPEQNFSKTTFVIVEDDQNFLNAVMQKLYERNIQSVIVEGGLKLLSSLISMNLWDEARIFTSNKIIHKGISAPKLFGKITNEKWIDGDRLTFIKPN